ncbi:MAG: gamma carbonic anhydrase family protein [Verrucomicrobia bacterium]|nr:gamma carbonic anhydrase family protein [Verrucomicrobiota bacterium]
MEFLSLSHRLEFFLGTAPIIHGEAYVAPSSTVLGNVIIGANSSIWFQAVLRADINKISVGSETNVQDGCILHVSNDHPLQIGDRVSCGHHAVLHACTIENEVLIGIGATVLDGAVIGSNCVLGAKTLVTKGTHIPAGSLVLGTPGKVVRTLNEIERDDIRALALKYVAVAKFYLNQSKVLDSR